MRGKYKNKNIVPIKKPGKKMLEVKSLGKVKKKAKKLF